VSNPLFTAKRAAARRARRALVAKARVPPTPEELVGAERRVIIVLMNAFGMGGTVRTVMNLAGYLGGRGYEVQILSVLRTADEPFFGDPPPGVTLRVLHDKRRPPSLLLHPIQRFMMARSSVLMHPDDRAAHNFKLWADWQLMRALRGRAGFLITTRPGLNLIAAELAPPGLIRIGQEHMHLRDHSELLQDSIKRRYRKLSALAVLTKRDRWRYRQHLGERPRVVLVPNTVRDMGPVRADLSAKTVLAAGRYKKQKGFDRLIKSWELVAPSHPDWQLRIVGNGPWREKLEAMVEERGLGDSVTLAPPAHDMGAEMEKASIFALSSRWEGLPLVLLEAMSVGMGVVSIDCPTGPADVIDDHENGLLIRPRTFAALAAGLAEMMDDEELRRRCAARAIETAREYRMDVVGPQWEQVLARNWQRRPASLRSGTNPSSP
jgi:glycosyltransferase involved in cell wall biosynthesis